MSGINENNICKRLNVIPTAALLEKPEVFFPEFARVWGTSVLPVYFETITNPDRNEKSTDEQHA
jgi:hypothetical protein